MNINLEEFELLFEVIKDKEEFFKFLCIAMEEPDAVISEVEIKQIYLDVTRKAIRIKVWAVDEQIQCDDNEEVGLMADIYITRDDLFGRDAVRYTFVNSCCEFEDLHLEGGTRKIYLNMTGHKGPEELVGIMQSMNNVEI